MSKHNNIMPKSRQISENFCFHRHYCDIKGTQGAYAYYVDHKKSAKELYSSSTPIAIDTNLLLNLYKISFAERKSFLKFIDKNAYRIIIPYQVQQEYMRHRQKHIQSFLTTLKDLPNQAKTAVETLKRACEGANEQLTQLLNRKIVSNDMPSVVEHIDALKKYIDEHKLSEEFITQVTNLFAPVSEALKTGVEKSLSQAVYELDDPVLASLSKAQILNSLSESELSFLEQKYNELLEIFEEHKTNIAEKEQFVFPGCGDRRKAKDGLNPCGDFYIYHELLSYMQRNNQDVVFLTNDVTKSDWIKSDRKPFGHYIIDTFMNTGHMLYIFNAQDFTTLTFDAVTDVKESETDGDESEKSEKASVADAHVAPVEPMEPDGLSHSDGVDIAAPEHADSSEKSSESESFERLPYLRSITEERFLQELETAEMWAESYGDGYVGKDFFIYNILGHKHFQFNISLTLLTRLVEEGKVVEHDVEREGKTIKSLKVKREKK